MKTRFKNLFASVQAPPKVYGWLDWATGLLFIDEPIHDVAHWQTQLLGSQDPHARELIELISHEHAHFQQIVTTGYLYQWACQYYRKLVAASDGLLAKHEFVAKPDAVALQRIEKEVDPKDRAALSEHLALLDVAGPNGVSTRALFEAQAFYIQKKSHWEGLDAAGYHAMLDASAPDRTYRHAYDLARCRLGDPEAFSGFPLITSLALCCENPPLAFDILLTVVAQTPLAGTPDPDACRDLLDELNAGGAGPLGTAAEVAESTRLTHPVYTPALLALNKKCGAGFSILPFFSDPSAGLEAIVKDVMRPMVFQSDDEDQFPVFLPPGMKPQVLFQLVAYSAFASRVLGPGRPGATTAPDAGGYDWLRHLRPELREFAIAPGMVGKATLDLLASLDPRAMKEPQRSDACSLFGRCLVTFGLGTEPLWLDPGVRRFIKGVHEANPVFPVFLSPEPAFGMFCLWFGALAETAAHHGSAIDLTHDSVVGPLMESVGALLAMATQLGLQPRPLLQMLLTPYPRDSVEELLQQLQVVT